MCTSERNFTKAVDMETEKKEKQKKPSAGESIFRTVLWMLAENSGGDCSVPMNT